MINIPLLRLRSGSVQLNELTIEQSLALAVIPAGYFEQGISRFITMSCPDCDPLKMTVEDRMMLVAHYLASTGENPDFAIGRAHFSDYLIGDENSRVDLVEIGDIDGDYWLCRTLTGEFSEAIERLQGETGLPPRVHWTIGRLASQLYRKDESLEIDDIDLWLKNRMAVFSKYPESSFMMLFSAYQHARVGMRHLFIIENDDKGIVAMPKEGVTDYPAARFPVDTCISDYVKTMAG